MKRTTITTIAALAVLAVGASTASAGTVSVDPQTVVFHGLPGETNVVTVQFGFKTRGAVLIRDNGGARLRSTSPLCVPINRTAAVCVNYGVPPFQWALVYGHDGNDRVSVTGGDAEFYGGPGDDVLTGGERHDRLFGEDGNDTLQGRVGIDHLFGGDGDDVLLGGEDTDWVQGDAGSDALTGGIGYDHMYGGIGNDLLLARDGEADDVFCDAGIDTAQVDAGIETYVQDCEGFLP